jgi:glycosyltransferase involved in cell wall biosynthesis
MRASIVIAAYNEGESLWQTIGACVETSAGLDQEIIVADDASFDGSVEDAATAVSTRPRGAARPAPGNLAHERPRRPPGPRRCARLP